MRTPFHSTLVLALLAITAASALAQTTTYVNIPGLCQFQALSWSMQENQTQSGKPAVTVSANKTVDVCSPLLYRAVVMGREFPSVTFTLLIGNENLRTAMPTLTLTGVLIGQTQLNDAPSAALPTETVSFLFETFTTQESTTGLTNPPNASVTTTLELRDLNCTVGVTAWNIAATVSTTAVPGGTTKGAPKLSTLQITKLFDVCSQQIVQAITNGQSLTQVILTQGDPSTRFNLTITLNAVPNAPPSQIISYHAGGVDQSGHMLETIEISYMEITFAAHETLPTGAYTNNTVTWNQFTQMP
jgi:type VI protein secretion system component Hcp